MRTHTSSIEFTRAKNKQAQLQVVTTKKTIDDVKLILQKKITTDGIDIRGCCMSAEGDMLYTDYQVQGASLTVIASDNKLKYKMPLDPRIKGKVGIDIIDIKKPSKIKFIKLPSGPYGIARDHNSLFVCVERRGIYKINILDGTTSCVISFVLPSHSYVAVYTDRIYYTNYEYNNVVCCDRNGALVWTFKDDFVLKEPEGIAVDNNGNVYVVGEKSSNVVILSNDGKHHKELL
ncbi:unnamed protein product [Mytilus edulis]|uniref:Uncharacterized protein n=1 Tax=Mytilus edulis TaxID=6550 RepID=A0A8S3T775_MYTED|nr:unnamed protein product [Mytilus edulis]